MPSAQAHSKIINRSARKAFRPLGITQEGASRTWLDDHGWWLTVIGFQPSAWSKGTYLNVGAMWLWRVQDNFSYDVGHRVNPFIEYKDDAQFETAIAALMETALGEIGRYRTEFSSIAKVARYYKKKPKKTFWDLLNGGIASGIAADRRTAERLLTRFIAIKDDRDWAKRAQKQAEVLLGTLEAPEGFAIEVAQRVRKTRELLKLPGVEKVEW